MINILSLGDYLSSLDMIVKGISVFFLIWHRYFFLLTWPPFYFFFKSHFRLIMVRDSPQAEINFKYGHVEEQKTQLESKEFYFLFRSRTTDIHRFLKR